MTIPWLDKHSDFPDVSQALKEESGMPGLLAAGADLSPERLLQAYKNGIFPWYSEGQPILWWSLDPRMVLYTKELKTSLSLKKKIKQCQQNPRWEFRFDSAFTEVMQGCAVTREGQAGTWITQDIIDAYTRLHHLGYAHSSEAWLDGQLVGACYGVCIGKMFYGESMFSRVSDASKMAFTHLCYFLREQGVEMIDCQQETSHLASLGARAIVREEFLKHLKIAINQETIIHWQVPILFQLNNCANSTSTINSTTN
jgi:leucyl/phenylalanyl-tRNA--protein transferase